MMNNKRNVALLAIIVISAFGLILWLALRQSSDSSRTVYASDVVASNMQFTDKLPEDKNNELLFFTGTALAKLEIPLTAPKVLPKSAVLFPDLAFENADRVRYSPTTTVVRANFTRASNLLPLAPSDEFGRRLTEGSNWFIVDGQGSVRALPVNDHSKVADCIVDDKTIYILLSKDSGTQQLLKMSATDKTPTLVADNIQATSFIGASKNRAFMRDYNGVVYLLRGSTLQEVAQKAGNVLFDAKSERLVIDSLEGDEVGEEGGAIIKKDKDSEPRKLRVFDPDGKLKREIPITGSLFSVSRGYLLTTPDTSQPPSITAYNLLSDEQFNITINHSSSRVTTQISQLHILKDDFSLIGAITASNDLILYGPAAYVAALPSHNLPAIPDDANNYILDYNVATDTITILYPADESRSGIVERTLSLLTSSCDCDLNQTAKLWQPSASKPGL